MKRILTITTSILILLSLCACSNIKDGTPLENIEDNGSSEIESSDERDTIAGNYLKEELAVEEIANHSSGKKIIAKYDKNNTSLEQQKAIYIIENGQELFLQNVYTYLMSDIGFFKNGDVYIFDKTEFNIYVNGKLDYELQCFFNFEENVVYAVQRIENGFYIIYANNPKESIGTGEADTTYQFIEIDKNGNIIKSLDTGINIQIYKSGYCKANIYTKDDYIELDIEMIDQSHKKINVDKNTFEIK